jgi:hypothetical protein
MYNNVQKKLTTSAENSRSNAHKILNINVVKTRSELATSL